MTSKYLSYSLLIGALALAGCSSEHKVAAASKPTPPKIVKAELQPVEDVLEIAAKVQADPARVVRVYPPAGGRLLHVEVRPGDHIRAGQTVATLESSDISQARADYAKAKTEDDRASREAARSKLLFEHKVISEREYLDAQAAQQEAHSELDRAASRLRVLGASLSATDNEVAVRSPLAGTVLDIGASSGELSKSTDNANPLCTVADLNEVWVVGDLYEKDLSSVPVGSQVEIRAGAYPDQNWNGRVSAVSDNVDPQSRTVKVRVVLRNADHKLKPDMFSTIFVRRKVPQALVIPSAAVLHEGGDSAVIVQVGDEKYERRLVTVRQLNPQQTEVLSGLKPGETVVSEGASLLRGGEGDQ